VESINEDASFTRDRKRVKNFPLNPKAYGFCSLVAAILREFEVLEDEECTEPEVKLRITFRIFFRRPSLI
jgi:hypothetical protein